MIDHSWCKGYLRMWRIAGIISAKFAKIDEVFLNTGFVANISELK